MSGKLHVIGSKSGYSFMGVYTWTPKVCRIIAFYRFWAILLPTVGGPGRGIFEGLEMGSKTMVWGSCVGYTDPNYSSSARILRAWGVRGPSISTL